MIRVFPTEAVAKSHMRTWCKSNPGRAVFKDEFVSWDTFKGMCLSVDPSLRKASFTDRRIFCEKILSDRSLVRRLRFFYNRDYEVSHRRFALSIARNLVFFKALEGKTLSSKAMENDVALLLCEYEKYLSENNLYEESYLSPDFSMFKGKAEICYAHTISDPLVRLALDSGVGELRMIGDLSPLHVYPNTRCEIRDVLMRIRGLLSQDIPCSDVSVTLAGDENLVYFLEQARLYNVPVRAAVGKSLSSYNSGRFFSCLEQCVSQNWSFESVKSLLADPSFPLKDRAVGISVLRKAVEKKISRRDDWLSKLENENRVYMEKLILLSERLVRGSDASDMQITLRRLQDDCFESRSWDSMEDSLESSAFQRCVRVLIELESAGRTEGLYGIFTDILSNTVYVSSEDNGGVSVFSYPMSCGLASRHHFVLGLEEKNVRTRLRTVPFDPEDENCEDLTLSVLVSLSHSCENSYLCCAAHSYHGYDSVPSEFVRFSGTINEDASDNDPYPAERSAWENGFDPEKKLGILPLDVQRSFFENARSSVCTSFSDRTSVIGLEKLSATAMDSFRTCPRQFYISKVLGVQQSEYDVQGEDARVIGEVLHEALERHLEKHRYFSRCAQEDFSETLDEVLYESEVVRRSIDALVSKRIRMSCLENLENFFRKGLEYFSDCVLVSTEEFFEFEEQDVRIRGFVDCILRDVTNGEIFIIDFKKGSYRKDSVQLPLYAMALGDDVRDVCYYVIKDSKFIFCFEKADRDALVFDVQQTVTRIKVACETGSFEKCENIKDCSGCAFRSICRRGYVLR